MRAKVVFLVIEFKFFCVFPSFDNFWEAGKSLRSQSYMNEITFNGFWTIGVAFGICDKAKKTIFSIYIKNIASHF